MQKKTLAPKLVAGALILSLSMTALPFVPSVQTVSAATVSYTAENAFDFDAASGCITAYKGADQIVNVPETIGGVTVTGIEWGAFSESTVTQVTLPDTITSIGSMAFENCKQLTSINIPDNIKILAPYTFYGCTNLTELTLPSTSTEIMLEAFSGCVNFRKITIPASVTTIDPDAFYNCNNLTIIAPKGSYAETFANSAGITFEELSTDDTTTPPGDGDGSTTTPGDGDGSTTTPGDGDGSTTTPGDGDGSTTTPGDGDGSTTTPGDGDGSTTTPGDGDGSTTTPGDGDGSTTTPGTNTGSGSATTPGTNTGGGSATTPGTNTGDGSTTTPGTNTGGGSTTTPNTGTETPITEVVEGSSTLTQVATLITSNQKEDDIKGATYAKLSLRVSKSTNKSQKIKWNKVNGADGYVIFANKCGEPLKELKTITNGKTTSYTNKKLKKGTYYKYVVLAYKFVDGKQITLTTSKTIHVPTTGGKVCDIKSIKVNKTNVTLKKGKAFTIKATEVKSSSKKKIQRHRKLSFESSNPKIATVSKKGKVKAMSKGTCYIYVYAQNGVFKKVKVKVK